MINTTTTTISPTIITDEIDATIITVLTFSKEKRIYFKENVTKRFILHSTLLPVDILFTMQVY